MPRARNRSSHTSSSHDAALLFADREIQKCRNEYKTYIKKINASAMLLAERLAHSGDVEAALFDNVNEDNNRESGAFLEEQRTRLKQLCERNVQSNRNIDAYVDAMTSVREDVLRLQQEEEARRNERAQDHVDGDEQSGSAPYPGEEVEPTNYENIIRDKILEYEERQKRNGSMLDMEDEDLVRKCCGRLGESSKKRSRSGRVLPDEDEDLEIMNQPGHGDSESALKCPITGMLFQNPVRNKVCGHFYELNGLKSILNSQKNHCPIPGCTNQRISLDQVEEDEEMKMKVRRYRIRSEQEKQQRMTGLDEEESIENEEEMRRSNTNTGMTVIE